MSELVLVKGQEQNLKICSNKGDAIIKVQIKCRNIQKKDKSGTFKSVKFWKKVIVINDGIVEGKKGRWMDLKFTKKAFNKDCNVHSIDDLTSGFLYVRANGLQAPKTYVIKEDENGDPIYPNGWVKDGSVLGFEPYVEEQDDYSYDNDKKDVVDAEVVEEEEQSFDDNGELKED